MIDKCHSVVDELSQVLERYEFIKKRFDSNQHGNFSTVLQPDTHHHCEWIKYIGAYKLEFLKIY